jgi:DNA polymerase-1
MPILLEGERLGVRCDLEALEGDMSKYETALLEVDGRIRKAIKSPECNLDSGRELADAIERAGLVKQWVLTPTGQRSTARKNLQAAIDSPRLVALLQYRGALAHCLSNFGRPWLAMAQTHGGRLYPEWNQVRQSRGQGRQDQMKGTRTGRLSSTNPNFQNPPNEYEGIIVPPGLPDLPIMRRYLLPEEGHVWLKRDYSQQELRILAHFSEGRLYERYCEDPRIDAHEETGALIREYAHMDLPRKSVKIVGFSIIYGSGVPHLSEWLGVDSSEGRATRDAYFLALPEVQTLMRNCSARGRFGQPITTWGGRNYLAEPGKNGRDFSYKLLNYLIQGSAADCTKEAIIRWHQTKAKNLGVFIATVHDEINIGAPKDDWARAMGELKKAMESIEFDVKMLSDGYKGPSWGHLTKLKLAS